MMKKVYPIDVALMDGREDAIALGNENLGWRLESIVYIELLRRINHLNATSIILKMQMYEAVIL